MEVQRRNFNCTIIKEAAASAQDRKRYKFVASSEDTDRMGDVIEVDGWETANWQKNPTILWGHDQKSPPIGRGLSVTKDLTNKQLIIEAEFVDKETYPLAGLVSDLIDKGFVKAVSVGFKPIDWEEREDVDDSDSWFPPLRFKRQELLELSVVSIPANPSALLITNSVGRDTLYSQGILPAIVHELHFADTFSKDQICEFCKSHDFVFDGSNSHVIPQKPISLFKQDSIRKIPLQEGVFALVGKLLPQDKEASVDPVAKVEIEVAAIRASTEENKKSLETVVTLIKDLTISISELKKKAVVSKPEAKASVGLAEQYFTEISSSMRDAVKWMSNPIAK